MMPAGDDEMSLREIARTLSDFRSEFRSQVGQLVRADVYRAEQASYDMRVTGLEKDRDTAEAERRQTHRLAIGAVLTCIGTVIAALILVALK